MKDRTRYLTDEELKLCRKVKEIMPPSTYTLAEFLEAVWEHMDDKKNLGRRFKKSVEAGQLFAIVHSGRTVENHQVYTVYAS